MDDSVDGDGGTLLEIRDEPVAANDHECVEVIEIDPFEDVATEEIVLLDLMRLELTDIDPL